MRKLTNVLVTGGAGFIGCNFIHMMLQNNTSFSGRIINLDALTYAGNHNNLADVDDRYIFIHGNICDGELVKKIFADYNIDTVVHFAAESHVDRSITGPALFIQTNIIGTFTLLEAARNAWNSSLEKEDGHHLFHHISTDEVFGTLDDTGFFNESTPYDPRSPYSASKASSDHLVNAYYHTYGLPITLSNCSNNYGPYQFPEKFIPHIINDILNNQNIPVYGDGKYIRDWIYVEDHNDAVWNIMQHAKTGSNYNIGGENEWENIKLVNTLLEIVCRKAKLHFENAKNLITFVKDRPGHDRRYAMDCTKIKSELGWKQKVSFAEGLEKTVDWYLKK